MREGSHISHPTSSAAVWAQVWAQGGRSDWAPENEMYRERMIGRVRKNLSMFVGTGETE